MMTQTPRTHTQKPRPVSRSRNLEALRQKALEAADAALAAAEAARAAATDTKPKAPAKPKGGAGGGGPKGGGKPKKATQAKANAPEEANDQGNETKATLPEEVREGIKDVLTEGLKEAGLIEQPNGGAPVHNDTTDGDDTGEGEGNGEGGEEANGGEQPAKAPEPGPDAPTTHAHLDYIKAYATKNKNGQSGWDHMLTMSDAQVVAVINGSPSERAARRKMRSFLKDYRKK